MRRVAVHTTSTAELGDLASLRQDLNLARTFLQLYLGSDIEDPAPDPSSIDALWIAAITSYGRAFANGKRHAARVGSFLDSDQERAHSYFIDVRNKYIAHAVNGFEKSVVFADLINPALGPGIARIGESHTRLSRLSREAAETLDALCALQIARLTERIEVLHRLIGQELAAIGTEAVYALPEFVPPTLDGSDPRSTRI